jgi:histidine ammonia-lyase
MVENLNHILGVELLCAAQGIEFRAPLKTSDPLARVVSRLRKDVSTLGEDRYLAPEIEQAAFLIASGEITRATATKLPNLESFDDQSTP